MSSGAVVAALIEFSGSVPLMVPVVSPVFVVDFVMDGVKIPILIVHSDDITRIPVVML
jgi:hypothetical protein